VGHYFTYVLARLAKKIIIKMAVWRVNRYALDRTINIKWGSRGGVYTTPQDFKKVIEKPPKDTVTPWDPSLLFSASQLLWEWGDIAPGLYLILA
jgi:hypothetical protein